ncbi:MAG: LamG-like jellyroll fold domain-containing protein [Candidatus Kariarchaeaceae archaeon]
MKIRLLWFYSMFLVSIIFSMNLLYPTISKSSPYQKSIIKLSQSSSVLIFHLSLDEGEGSSIGDNVNGLVGELRGGSWEQGVNGQAIGFIDSTDRIGFDDHPVFDFVMNNFTISMWIKINSLGNDPVNLISHGDGPGTQKKWMLTLGRAGDPTLFNLVFHSWDNTLTQVKSLGTPPIEFRLNNWQFLTLTRNRPFYSFYVNNTLVAVENWTYDIGMASEQLSIGYMEPWDANVVALDGIMDEISIFGDYRTIPPPYSLTSSSSLDVGSQTSSLITTTFMSINNDNSENNGSRTLSFDVIPIFRTILVIILLVILVFGGMRFLGKQLFKKE